MNLKRTLWAAGALAALAGLAAAGTALKKTPVGTARRAPTARVERGSLKLDVQTTGAFKAARVVPLSAPSAGGGLRLIHLAETGTPVHAGDVVMEFDPAEQQYALDQALSELAEAEQQVVRRKADIEAMIAQDEGGQLNARYRVRRAELDAKTPERLLSANEFQKRKLTLEEMKRRLAQTEHDVVSNRTTLGAALAVVEQARNRSRINADRARQIIDSLVVRAPLDGLVLVRENRDATGGVFYSGMSLPEYRVGDTVWSGRVIADVSDISDLEITVRVNEQDRAALNVGQPATVQADAAPGKGFGAHIAGLSGVALRSRDQQGPLRQFEVTLRLDSPDARLRPGTTARVLIGGPEIKNVLTVPRQAVYREGGKSVVYVPAGDRFEAREVKVTHQSASRAAVEGVAEGTDVA
ncbi:MAG: HlyD family efflux transporter periplasmic adaptor subunit, partial [Candidatus Rokuibacteriota bacterium]